MLKYRPPFATVPIAAIVQIAVACFLLAIGLRTWLVMGLIEPVTVAGSSMVPTFRGLHVTPQCPECGHWLSVGAKFALDKKSVSCPQCAEPNVSLEKLALRQADRLWINRSLLQKKIKRWDLIVTHNPQDGEELCIKRIVGLPGERISLQDGDVLVDGAVVVKSLNEQHRMRRQVHREQKSSQRWQAGQGGAWEIAGDIWQYDASEVDAIHWLRYQHPRPITDDVTYNVGLTRQLNLVDELMLAVEVNVQGTGTLSLTIDDGTIAAQLDLDLRAGELRISGTEQLNSTHQLSDFAQQRLAYGKVQLALSNFDGQLLLVIGGHAEFRQPWQTTKSASTGKTAGTDRPFAIGVQGLDVRLAQLAVYRDTYHSNRAVGVRPAGVSEWQLGEGEFFLLGDNSPVSVDSRLWGPVPGRLFLGKPFLSGR